LSKKKDKSIQSVYAKLLRLERISIEKEDKIKNNWERYENFFLGAHWDNSSKTPVYTYNSSGTRIMLRDFDDDNLQVKMPKRTQNEIWIQVQSELALYVKQNYYIQVMPRSFSDDVKEKAWKQNLYLRSVLRDDFLVETLRMFQDIILFGTGLFKIVKVNVKEHDVPFRVIRVSPKEISIDPNVDRFEDINWIIHNIEKYIFELKDKYPDTFKVEAELDDYSVIKVKEFWVKEKNVWKRYLVYGGKILNEKEAQEVEYPYHPFAWFTANMRVKGAWGISEVEQILEYQKMINKRLSQYDYYLNYLVVPAVSVDGNLDPNEAKKFPIKAGEYYVTRGGRGVNAISLQQAPESYFHNSINIARDSMQRTTEGVYSAKHFANIYESAITRLKLKEVFYKKGFRELGRTLLKWGVDYLGKSGYFIIYDENKDKDVKVTSDDLRFERMEVKMFTSDANLLDPLTRIDYLIKMKQYAPEIDSKEIIMATEKLFPTYFTEEYIDAIKKQIEMDRDKVNSAYQQMKQAKQQKAETPQMPSQPPAGGEQTPAEAGGIVDQTLEILKPLIDELIQRGNKEEDIINSLSQAIQVEIQKGINDPNQIAKDIENIIRGG